MAGMALILLLLVIAGWIAFTTIKTAMLYTIPNHQADIETHLIEWQKRTGDEHDLTLLTVKRLGDSDTLVAFFESEAHVWGFATLKEGSNQKLRIVESQYGDSDYSYDGVSTNHGDYAIVTARNLPEGARFGRVKLVNTSFYFPFAIPDEPILMLMQKVPDGLASYDYDEFTFYDQDYQEID